MSEKEKYFSCKSGKKKSQKEYLIDDLENIFQNMKLKIEAKTK